MSGRIPAGGAFKAATGMHESLSVDHVREARRALHSYCLDERHCQTYLRLLTRASGLVAKSRIVDLAWDEGYQGLDAPLFQVVRKLAGLYGDLIAGKVVVVGDFMAVRLLSNIQFDGVEYESGDVALMDVGQAVRLVAAGLAEPVESNVIKLLARQAAPGSQPVGVAGE